MSFSHGIYASFPIPLCFDFLDSDSDSDSSIKWNHSGIDSDSGIGIVHHCIMRHQVTASGKVHGSRYGVATLGSVKM